MNVLVAALRAEGLKVRKSKMIWVTFAAFTLAPLLGGFFIYILKDPQLAEQSGLLGAKAQLRGEANWPTYFGLLAQTVGVGGLIVFGFVTSWVFGREFSDRTAKDLLALPCPRIVIIFAKFMTVSIVSVMLCTYVLLIGTFIGLKIGLPGWSEEVLREGVYVFMITSLLTILLNTPAAFFASYGRGYLAPLGFIILMIVLAQMISAIGYGEYFPWAVPAIYSGVSGAGNMLGSGSFIAVIATCILCAAITFAWWIRADQH